MCVTTCPTGIDIRDGLQMECIGCAQCIDACDAVMEKLKRPRGLIRYSSQARLSGEAPHMLRPRTAIYPALLTVIAVAFVLVLLNQSPTNVTVLRGLGRPYTLLPDGSVENNIRIKIFNRTDKPVAYTFSASDERGVTSLNAEENPATVKPGESKTVPAIVVAPASAFTDGTITTKVHITDGGEFKRDVRYTLQGPMTAGTAPAAPAPDHHDHDDKNGHEPLHEGAAGSEHP
jgi:cytochrome c oxidase accessory protein FixG